MNGAAMPEFAMEGGAALVLLRGLSVAALLSVFGTLVFRAAIAPPVLARMDAGAAARVQRRWRHLFWSSWVAAFVATIGWLLLQTATMADAPGVIACANALPTVLADTQFGHLVLLRSAVLLLTGLVAACREPRLRIAAGLAGIATALQAGHGHAASMYDGPSLLLLSEVAHLLAAGVWLGALLPLVMLVAAASPQAGALASRRFSPVGAGCVLLLAITAGVQFWVLIGGLPGLIGSAYGDTALFKLALFATLIGLALVNRFRLTPLLATASADHARRRLCRTIAVEAGVGMLVVLAAGLLTSLPPAMHVQPVWPFAERLSLAAVREDPGFRLEVIQAGLALAGALALLAVAALLRRVRWPAVALAAAIGWLAVPHLDLLLVPAYPTSFYKSPTGFAAEAIVAGARLYSGRCSACHGAEGHGDGPAAKDLPIPPADLTAAHLWAHDDGELFWWLSHGIDAPEGGQAMPGFATVLSEDERWDLIDYIRANNAGATMRGTESWSPPVQAPDLQATCGEKAVALHDLRGRFVRLVIGTRADIAGQADAVTIVVTPYPASAATGVCVAADETVARAYAIVSGMSEQRLPGTQFLIDGDGWLRALQRPGEPRSWNEANALAAEIGRLRARPVAAPATSGPMNMRM